MLPAIRKHVQTAKAAPKRVGATLATAPKAIALHVRGLVMPTTATPAQARTIALHVGGLSKAPPMTQPPKSIALHGLSGLARQPTNWGSQLQIAEEGQELANAGGLKGLAGLFGGVGSSSSSGAGDDYAGISGPVDDGSSILDQAVAGDELGATAGPAAEGVSDGFDVAGVHITKKQATVGGLIGGALLAWKLLF